MFWHRRRPDRPTQGVATPAASRPTAHRIAGCSGSAAGVTTTGISIPDGSVALAGCCLSSVLSRNLHGHQVTLRCAGRHCACGVRRRGRLLESVRRLRPPLQPQWRQSLQIADIPVPRVSRPRQGCQHFGVGAVRVDQSSVDQFGATPGRRFSSSASLNDVFTRRQTSTPTSAS